MPKETVYGSQLPFEEGVAKAIAEVSWSRESEHVQIVTKAVEPTLEGRVSDDPGVHYTDGFYVDLDRRGINQLIQKLRRARDQAFGRDE